MQQVLEYYNKYDEDTRLLRHKTEFIVTTWILNDLIKGKQRILDVAAGTGRYAAYYANHSCHVVAMDIVPKHIHLLQKKYAKINNLNACVGDARNLSAFNKESFDVVLNMGALYHIDEKEIKSCIRCNLKVLKPGGILAVAYINKFLGYENDKYLDYFKFYTPQEIKQFFSGTASRELMHTPVDGESFNVLNMIAPNIVTSENGNLDLYNELEDLHFWLSENYTTEDIITTKKKFIHALYVARKTKAQ